MKGSNYFIRQDNNVSVHILCFPVSTESSAMRHIDRYKRVVQPNLSKFCCFMVRRTRSDPVNGRRILPSFF